MKIYLNVEYSERLNSLNNTADHKGFAIVAKLQSSQLFFGSTFVQN